MATDTVRNVVLVHGGFVDGSGWQGVGATVSEVAASHSVYVSQPEGVATVIAQAAAGPADS